jgi:hypothetical protein
MVKSTYRPRRHKPGFKVKGDSSAVNVGHLLKVLKKASPAGAGAGAGGGGDAGGAVKPKVAESVGEAWGLLASTNAPDHDEAKARFRYMSLMDMYIIINYGYATTLKAAAGAVVAKAEFQAAYHKVGFSNSPTVAASAPGPPPPAPLPHPGVWPSSPHIFE